MSATKFVMVGLVALCMLSIVAPAASAAASHAVDYYRPCNIKIAYIAGHDVVVDGHTIVHTSGGWICV